MKKIKDFYDNLTDAEKDLISKTLLKNERLSKSKILLNRLSNYDDLIETVVAKDLYNEAPNSSYSHLKRRFKEKIIEIIYDHEVSDQSNDSIFSDKVKCQKYLLLAELLIEKGFKDDAKSHLKLAEKIINKRQFNIERIMLNLYLLEVNDSTETHHDIQSDLERDIADIKEFSVSKVQFYNPVNQDNSNGETKFSHNFNSNVFSSYYKLLTEINTQNDLFQYSNALKLSESLVQIVKTSAESFSHSEITKVWLTHLRVLIYNNKFQDASVLCRQLDESEAVRYDLVNEYMLLKWQLSFMKKDYNLAENLHAELGMFNNFSESEQCIISYFKLCLLFNEGKYEEVTNYLVQKNSMQGTNSPIPHAAKLLEIYCYLEQKKTDVANSKLMAFKQYLKRNNSFNKDRYQFIVKVLLKVLRSEYKYEAALQHYIKNEEESFASDCRFIPNYHRFEIIDFKGWLTSKCVPVEQKHLEKVKA